MSGIRIRWKHIVQRPDCDTVEVKLYVNNRFTNKLSHYYHKNIEWVEIKAEKTFELRIQALYQIEPKCIQARRMIKIGKLTEQRFSKDTANGTSATTDTFFTKDDYKNTIIISLSSLLVIIIIVFTVIAVLMRKRMRKRIREDIMKVDDNSDVYGTYYGGEAEYSEVADSNPYYGS